MSQTYVLPPGASQVSSAMAQEILSGPDYFYCGFYRCWLRREHCEARVKAKIGGYNYFQKGLPAFPDCRDCPQGRGNVD